MRILVVDDERAVRVVLERSFRSAGHDVSAVDSAAAALEVTRCWLPNAAVVDVNLPDGNGVDLVAAMRRIHSQMTIVVLTGFGTIRTAVEAIKAGATDYVSKPVGYRELLFRLDPDHRQRTVSEDAPQGSQMTLDQVRWDLIQRTLTATGHNVSEAARRLGIRRQSLQRMLKKLPMPFMR